jgi:sphingolipid 4-desaturase/C4-monooxygenase
LANAAIFHYWGLKALVYTVISTLCGMSLHPASGHLIAEHYQWVKSQETYSYYGPINWVNYNVGYHNEHHDFPKIPWSRLPLVKEMAPEFYTLPSHTSYLALFWRFITDDTLGPYSRIKRPRASVFKD